MQFALTYLSRKKAVNMFLCNQVMDRCNCCYVCGAGEGHRCYNSSLSLPYNPDVGICGSGMSCLLRNDLEPNVIIL
jgi:hypothetical protein